MKEPVIEVKNLSVCYDKTPALWEVGFEVHAGHLVAILGPNGAGKSTLLKTLLGAVAPLSGTVALFGTSPKRAASRIAFVPQRSSVDWEFPVTVFDVVLMGCYRRLGLFRRASGSERRLVEETLERMGMVAYRDRQISELSGGQQQRVFIARALVQKADLYLMDEPFAGVDMATEKALMGLLNTLKQEGKTIVIVHHDLVAAKELFDQAILLSTCLIASGPTAEVVTPEHLSRAYGPSGQLLEEVRRSSAARQMGR
ncbi:MAG: High-affinity zinc uptake system ATP-binding protein ZnuC [Chlamydiae bacterium]|nr:High-affinity zinc uptake system ATP-binding protein ZnuC [Chlamydiota bacterium]